MSSPIWFLHWSLLRGWLPVLVDVVAWTTLVGSVAWWRRPAWHWVVIAGAAGAVALVGAHLIDAPARFGSGYPHSFVAWGALPVFALGAAVWQWPRVGWTRKIAALASIPAMALFAPLQINLHYGYVPTVGDLLRARLPGQVEAARLLTYSATKPASGLVARLDLPAPASRFRHREGWVWVPPAFFAVPRPHLPVLMLITGTPGRPDDWLRAGGALELANNWAAAHHGIAPVMVFPDANGSATADTECVDGPRGRAETYLTVDVPRFMIEHFGVAASPRAWAVAGLSEGGTCALHLAARHPDRFSTFADFSGDTAPTLGSVDHTVRALYNGSTREWREHDPTRWFAKDASAGTEGFFAVGRGSHDDIVALSSLTEHARDAHLNVIAKILPGSGHDWYTWKRALAVAYPWIISRF